MESTFNYELNGIRTKWLKTKNISLTFEKPPLENVKLLAKIDSQFSEPNYDNFIAVWWVQSKTDRISSISPAVLKMETICFWKCGP